MSLGIPKPASTFLGLLVAVIFTGATSLVFRTGEELSAYANKHHIDSAPRAQEYLHVPEIFSTIEVRALRRSLRNSTQSNTEALQDRLFEEKLKTSHAILRNVAADRDYGEAASTWYGKLATLTEAATPAAVCLPQAWPMPWLRLLLRMKGVQAWSDVHDRIVNAAVADNLTIIGSDIPTFLRNHGGEYVKVMLVRDPVTRLLWNYLETCRSQGKWDECMSSNGRPVSFSEMVEALAYRGTRAAPPSLRLQLDACDMRSHNYDVVGWHEDLGFSARAFLTTVGLWDTYGANGWGDLEDAKFSDIFPMDRTYEKVCDFYNPDLLRTVQRLYDEDFETFGYQRDTWKQRCTAHWAAAPITQPLQVYERATKCMPTAEELEGLAGSPKSADNPPAPTFFLHTEGGFDFSEVLNCYLRQNHMSLDRDDWDDHVHANVSEHLGEIWLLKALESHPQRTMDVQKADLHIIGALPFISYLAIGKCGTAIDHEERMVRVVDDMENLPSYKESKGWNFFVFTTHFRLPEIYTEPLLAVLNEGNVIVGTADIDYTHWKMFPNIRRKVVIPYKAHHLVENAAFDEDRHGARGVDFLFRGKIGRSNEGSNRMAMWELMKNAGPNVDIKDVRFIDADPAFSDQLALLYGGSRFCLAPAGDSPTSRRLFDALAGGCVPLALGDFDKLSRNLPFKRTIDWASIVLYAGSLPCVDSDQPGSKAWLDAVKGAAYKELSMRLAGQEVFKSALSYTRNGEGLVTALLKELAHEL